MTVGELARWTSFLEETIAKDVGVEILRGSGSVVVWDLRPIATAEGHASPPGIVARENDLDVVYDPNHQFSVTALIIDGTRRPVGDLAC